MREFSSLPDKRILTSHIATKHKTMFGSGLLMPIFVSDEKEVGLIIAETKEAQKLGDIVPVEVAERLATEAEAAAYLSFPINENGLKSINALRDWLDILEGFILEDAQ